MMFLFDTSLIMISNLNKRVTRTNPSSCLCYSTYFKVSEFSLILLTPSNLQKDLKISGKVPSVEDWIQIGKEQNLSGVFNQLFVNQNYSILLVMPSREYRNVTYQALVIIATLLIIFKVEHMYNKEFLKYERLKNELEGIKNLCADQYFAVSKCMGGQVPNGPTKCGKFHVERQSYPCIHFYMGNCKYGFNCLFSHSIKRQIVKPEPPKEVCRKLYYDNFCSNGNKCRFSHDLRTQPCVYNSLGKCKFSDDICRFSHQKKIDVSVPCFFNLMGGCKNEQCENKHTFDNIIKYISYQGPI